MIEPLLFSCYNLFVIKGKDITLSHAFLVVEPPQVFDARIGGFFWVVGELHGGLHGVGGGIVAGCQLVHSRKGGFVAPCDHVGAHAPAVDGSLLLNQCLDDFLRKLVGNGDGGIGEPFFI